MLNRPSDDVAVLDAIDPVSQGVGDAVTAWIDVSKFHAIAGLVQVGALGASATVDPVLEQAQDSSGTGAKDLKAGTQLTQADSDDNKQVWLEAALTAMDKANDFTHVRLKITVGTAASLVSGAVLGFRPRFAPARDHDATSVDEVAQA